MLVLYTPFQAQLNCDIPFEKVRVVKSKTVHKNVWYSMLMITSIMLFRWRQNWKTGKNSLWQTDPIQMLFSFTSVAMEVNWVKFISTCSTTFLSQVTCPLNPALSMKNMRTHSSFPARLEISALVETSSLTTTGWRCSRMKSCRPSVRLVSI